MGILKTGPLGDMNGKTGNLVYYKLGDITVSRTIGIVTSWSEAQLEVQMKTALIAKFLNPVKEFVKIGFKTAPKPKSSWNAYTHATSVNRKTAIKGVYPGLEVDFEKVLFSMGSIPVPKTRRSNSLIMPWNLPGKLIWKLTEQIPATR